MGYKHRETKDENGHTLPAMIYSNGKKEWYNFGQLHNIDKDANGNILPAVVYPDGRKEWYEFGNIIKKNYTTEYKHTIIDEIKNEL
jgi:hypothetical protein